MSKFILAVKNQDKCRIFAVNNLVVKSSEIEGIVEMMLDATQRHTFPLTNKRFFGWHSALFPTGHSAPYEIEVGKYCTGGMQVVSGAMGKEKIHYEVLQRVQHSTGDITGWLEWFLQCLKNAMLATENTTQRILYKAEFWKLHEHTPINERQRLMINKLFDGFEGKLQTSKWAKITKTSTDTALRDIKDLVAKDILQQTVEGGRNTNYELSDFIRA